MFCFVDTARFDRSSSSNNWSHPGSSSKIFNSNSSSTTKPWAKDSWRPNAEPTSSSERWLLFYLLIFYCNITNPFAGGVPQVRRVIPELGLVEDLQITQILIWCRRVHLHPD